MGCLWHSRFQQRRRRWHPGRDALSRRLERALYHGRGERRLYQHARREKRAERRSGTKNAVVGTSDGSRLLYTEESTEVWFTDYGFGKLDDGAAIIPIDPMFAQTVNLEDEPYHVFVQVYGNAEVYVTGRTPTQFEVRLREGDPNAEFSYRVVGKRLGYEDHRLERAPWADNDLNLSQ